MSKGQRQKLADVVFADHLPETLKESMRRNGLWRCHVLVPDCPKRPYAQVYRRSLKIYSLFCQKHAVRFAKNEGLTIALPDAN